MQMENFKTTSQGSLCPVIHYPKSDKRDSQVEVKRIGVVVGNIAIGVSHLNRAYHTTKRLGKLGVHVGFAGA